MTDTQVNWLTQEAYDRLKAELDQLIAHRPIIAAEINDRREEGDLRENGGYHAAREEQGQEEARIRQLQELLNNAKVGEAPKQSGVALPGSVVTVCLRKRQDRQGDLPDRHAAGGRQRRQARGVLAALAAGRSADRREGRREAQLHRAQRQRHRGDAEEGRALPLLTRPLGAVALQSWLMAQIAEDLFLLLLDNAAGQPGLDRSRRQRVLSAAVLLDLALLCRVRPTMNGEPVPPGRLVALAGPMPLDPIMDPAFDIAGAPAADSGCRGVQTASRNPGEHRAAPRTHRSDPPCSVAAQAIAPSLRLAGDEPSSG